METKAGRSGDLGLVEGDPEKEGRWKCFRRPHGDQEGSRVTLATSCSPLENREGLGAGLPAPGSCHSGTSPPLLLRYVTLALSARSGLPPSHVPLRPH